MTAPVPPAGSEHYREGWRHGYEQAAIDRERSVAAARLVPAGAEGDTPTAPAAGDVWHEALRRLDALGGVYTGSARIEEIRSWVERGGDGAAEAVDALTGGPVPDTGQAREPARHREGPGAGWPRVAGRCPGCNRASLFLAAGEHVTCSHLNCPAPCAADDLLHPVTPSGDTVQPVGGITIDAIAWYCDACGALRSAPNGAIITTACVCGSSLMTGRGVGRTSGDTVQAPDVAAATSMDQTDPDHCDHCGLLVCPSSPCCEAWEQEQANEPAFTDSLGVSAVVRVRRDVLRYPAGTIGLVTRQARNGPNRYAVMIPGDPFEYSVAAKDLEVVQGVERWWHRARAGTAPDTGHAREPRVTVRTTQETTEEWRARAHRENPCACGGAFWVGSHSLDGCVGMVEEPSPAPDVAAPCPQHPPVPGHGDELIAVPVIGCPTCH